MTTEKLQDVFNFYFNWLGSHTTAITRGDDAGFPHLRWMCQTALGELIPNGKIDKAYRWLGFIQGVLCRNSSFTVAQLREHSRSEEDDNGSGGVQPASETSK